MICPVCQEDSLYVTNTYNAGDHDTVQRRVCEKCGTVASCLVTIIAVSPGRGKGAALLAKSLRQREAVVEVTITSLRKAQGGPETGK